MCRGECWVRTPSCLLLLNFLPHGDKPRGSVYASIHLSLQTVGDLLLAGIDMSTLLVSVGIVSKDVGLVEGVLGRLLELLVKHILHLVLSQSWVLLLQNGQLTLHIRSESSLRVSLDKGHDSVSGLISYDGVSELRGD